MTRQIQSEGRLKKLRRAFVETNLDRARKNPFLCGRIMKEHKHYYSSNTDLDQIEDHIKAILRKIDREGIKYAHKIKQIEEAPDFAKPRKPRKKDESGGFFPPEQFKQEKANAPWEPKETDRMLDLLLSGTDMVQVALKLKRNQKAVERHFQELLYNEKGKASEYKPVQRYPRKGKRLSPLEKNIVKQHKELEVPKSVTARILQRPISDFFSDVVGVKVHHDSKAVGSGVDLVLAHRYLYWAHRHPVISDEAYDEIKAEELEFGAHSQILEEPSSDKVADHPAHIRALAYYLLFKYMVETGQWNEGALPPDFFKTKPKDTTDYGPSMGSIMSYDERDLE